MPAPGDRGVASAAERGVGGPTVGEILANASATLERSGSSSPRLDAELLLAHVLGVNRSTLLAEPEALVSEGQRDGVGALIERRASGEPVAYIRGLKEFYGLALGVDTRALIPRPDTETIVEIGLARLSVALTSGPRDGRRLTVWDVGTGSGAIVIALAVEARRRGYLSDLRFRATDVSADALRLAVENAVAHGVADSVEFATVDLVDPTLGLEPADLLVANLPYVPTAELPRLPVAAHFEPQLALDGGPDGMAVIRRLVGQLPGALVPTGTALMEIGSDQVELVRNATDKDLPGWSVQFHADLGGQPRVAELTGPRP